MSDVLKDDVIIFTDIDDPDKDAPYPVTQVYRYDFDGNPEDLIKLIDACPQIIEGGKMINP